jgi:predicted nuclease with TOPRIM domain
MSSLPNFFCSNLDKKYQLKFEVMVKCITQLKEKIIEMINTILNKVNNINEENSKLGEKNKNLINEQNDNKKDNQILKDKLNMVYQELYNTKNNFESLNNEHQNLKNDFIV